MRELTTRVDVFPMQGEFRISREARTEATVVVAEVREGEHVGRGECVPYARYSETVDGVVTDINALGPKVADGLTAEALQTEMKPGAARCALDCALLDLEAKLSGTPVAERFGIALEPVTTAYTISLGEPEAMAEAARTCGHPLLKVKLGRPSGDDLRIKAIREAVPDARLIVDANEGWSAGLLLKNLGACADAGVALVEQPVPAARDGVLATISHPVPICADESAHTTEGLDVLKGRYDAVNVKLNKTGGLTEALHMVTAARAAGFDIMIGCMVGTSLAMAPAILAAQNVAFVDLDGPLLLAKDRDPALHYDGAILHPPSRELWG